VKQYVLFGVSRQRAPKSNTNNEKANKGGAGVPEAPRHVQTSMKAKKGLQILFFLDHSGFKAVWGGLGALWGTWANREQQLHSLFTILDHIYVCM
jgi:hypothetical protein